MSQSIEDTEQVDILQCTICLEDYHSHGKKTPRILPLCLHTFCEGCLEQVAERNNFTIPCPVCRECIRVLDVGEIQDFPINSRLCPIEIICTEDIPDSNLLDFIDPEIPSCPVCGSMTLYAPFGQDADIVQCHTCQWISAEVAECAQVASRAAVRVPVKPHMAHPPGVQHSQILPTVQQQHVTTVVIQHVVCRRRVQHSQTQTTVQQQPRQRQTLMKRISRGLRRLFLRN
ncbi:tripartite motif-containing protein 2-like [Protopterus annectens]|uniref:tripartite motif-containing protein 2-like n=1 Tax=Protopterus annectens TaxID=7888 RepID=UPI001CF9F1D2|nr:tripartite motif-containing protein 2-like [Protopterus annectens]